MMCKEVA